MVSIGDFYKVHISSVLFTITPLALDSLAEKTVCMCSCYVRALQQPLAVLVPPVRVRSSVHSRK